MKSHYKALEEMYFAGPLNRFYQPEITVSEGRSEISMALKEDFHHAAGAVHGSVYFKMLDDAAYFAVASLENEVFVVTTSFTTYITRSVSEGIMRAEGRVVNANNTQWISESVVYNSEGLEIARGNGVFVRSRIKLGAVAGYGV